MKGISFFFFVDFFLEKLYYKNGDSMKRVLFATGNAAKVKRFKDKLSDKGIELLSLKDLDISLSVEENGTSAIENALIKARACLDLVDMPVMAMDDSLYLEGVPEELQPGLFVRRINGKSLTDEEMIEHYSNLVKNYGSDGKLIARWVYGMAIISDGKEVTYTWSKNDFLLVDKPSKVVNLGYPLNSISKNIKLDKYFSEMTQEDQESVQEQEDDVIEFIAQNI